MSGVDSVATPSGEPWDGRHTHGLIDNVRTCLQERFFAHFPALNGEELLGAVKSMDLDLDAAATTTDAWEVYSGSVYWTLFVTGFLEYDRGGSLDANNTYLSYMLRYYHPRSHDPGLDDILSDPDEASERILRRFRDFALFRAHAGAQVVPAGSIEPVIVVISEHGPALLTVYDVAIQEPAIAASIDGWHRLFGAKVWGVRALQGEYVYSRS